MFSSIREESLCYVVVWWFWWSSFEYALNGILDLLDIILVSQTFGIGIGNEQPEHCLKIPATSMSPSTMTSLPSCRSSLRNSCPGPRLSRRMSRPCYSGRLGLPRKRIIVPHRWVIRSRGSPRHLEQQGRYTQRKSRDPGKEVGREVRQVYKYDWGWVTRWEIDYYFPLQPLICYSIVHKV